MSYSNQNPAFDRMLKGKQDARIQWEAARANELQRTGMSRDAALRQAAKEYTSRDVANPFCGLTDEDRMIFRRLLSVQAQARYHKQDRAAAHTMVQCSRGMRCPCGACRSAVTFTCVLGPHCPVQS